MKIEDWIGSIGVFMILLAFFLNVNGKLDRSDIWYILLNLVGAVMACLASLMIEYVPFIILEGTWGLVSLNALRIKLINSW